MMLADNPDQITPSEDDQDLDDSAQHSNDEPSNFDSDSSYVESIDEERSGD